uniref:Polysaccharide biosynthesis protein n=1 Tax=Polynucleobacter necessarius subsp. necessarius (strain STIR1) TaxID=452638 RepID=B1XTG1_POLNS
MRLSPSHVIALQKGIQAGTGLITALLITIFLTPEEQGYFYTMGSLLSSYTLLDLGLSSLLVQICAKNFSKLHWTNHNGIAPIGEPRLLFLDLIKKSMRWYFYAGITSLLLIPIGIIYFSYSHIGQEIAWLGPWVIITLSLTISMPTIGLMAILEGSHRITEAYSIRSCQYVIGAFLAWILLYTGYGLYALAMPPLATFLLVTLWVQGKYRTLITEVINVGDQFKWKLEVKPLHRKVALTWFSNYLFLHTPTPIIFYFLGSVKAGQFGLSMTIANVLASIGTSKVAAIIPRFSHLVEEGSQIEADTLFMKNFWQSMLICTCGAVIISACTYILASNHIVSRLLPWNELGILMFSLVGFHSSNLMAAYFRAYGEEPMAKVNIYMMLGVLFTAGHLIKQGIFLGAMYILVGGVCFLLIKNLQYRLKVIS